MVLDFDEVSDRTRPETPASLRDPSPKPQVIEASQPFACRPSCWVSGGCADCNREAFPYSDEQPEVLL